MNAKDYFSRALDLDERINLKLEELEMLKAMALRSTTVLNGLPGTNNPVKRSMADTLDRVVDMQQEINRDIDELVDLKVELREVISRIPDTRAQRILEARYFCGKTWKEISELTFHSLRWVQTLHERALATAEPYIRQITENAGQKENTM